MNNSTAAQLGTHCSPLICPTRGDIIARHLGIAEAASKGSELVAHLWIGIVLAGREVTAMRVRFFGKRRILRDVLVFYGLIAGLAFGCGTGDDSSAPDDTGGSAEAGGIGAVRPKRPSGRGGLGPGGLGPGGLGPGGGGTGGIGAGGIGSGGIANGGIGTGGIGTGGIGAGGIGTGGIAGGGIGTGGIGSGGIGSGGIGSGGVSTGGFSAGGYCYHYCGTPCSACH